MRAPSTHTRRTPSAPFGALSTTSCSKRTQRPRGKANVSYSADVLRVSPALVTRSVAPPWPSSRQARRAVNESGRRHVRLDAADARQRTTPVEGEVGGQQHAVAQARCRLALHRPRVPRKADATPGRAVRRRRALGQAHGDGDGGRTVRDASDRDVVDHSDVLAGEARLQVRRRQQHAAALQRESGRVMIALAAGDGGRLDEHETAAGPRRRRP